MAKERGAWFCVKSEDDLKKLRTATAVKRLSFGSQFLEDVDLPFPFDLPRLELLKIVNYSRPIGALLTSRSLVSLTSIISKSSAGLFRDVSSSMFPMLETLVIESQTLEIVEWEWLTSFTGLKGLSFKDMKVDTSMLSELGSAESLESLSLIWTEFEIHSDYLRPNHFPSVRTLDFSGTLLPRGCASRIRALFPNVTQFFAMDCGLTQPDYSAIVKWPGLLTFFTDNKFYDFDLTGESPLFWR
jgi:hypothetical protein